MVILMFFVLSFLWFIRTFKATLFWLYLWQLKEYHTGRFLDHFRTRKGKNLFLNLNYFLKLILFSYALILSQYPKLLNWQFYAAWIIILVIIYFCESGKFSIDIIRAKIKKPILTPKTLTLILANLIFTIFFAFFLFKKINLLYWFSFGLLSFDLLTPFLVSGIVLLFQPFTVLLRNQIIKKAKGKREKFKDLIVIGITGSYGKTSTKEFLATILAEKYKVLRTKEHQNSEVGISQCILDNLKPEHEIFVVEMGAYNRGGIKLLCDITKPKIGIITGVNEQHLATFGTMENLISAEGGKEVLESLPEDGLIIFNGNNKYCRQIYEKTEVPKKICYNTFSTVVRNVLYDFLAENVKVEKEFIFFEVVSKEGERVEFKMNLLGVQNIENLLLAACCAKELGVPLDEISKTCQKLKPLPRQMELKKGINGLNIIDSTYSVNPDGVISHLEYLKVWPGKRVIIMPCLIELGKASKEVHQRIGQKIGQICDLAIITTKERFREVKDGSASSPRGGIIDILFIENPKEIFEKIKKFCGADDVILLESRVPIELTKQLVIAD